MQDYAMDIVGKHDMTQNISILLAIFTNNVISNYGISYIHCQTKTSYYMHGHNLLNDFFYNYIKYANHSKSN